MALEVGSLVLAADASVAEVRFLGLLLDAEESSDVGGGVEVLAARESNRVDGALVGPASQAGGGDCIVLANLGRRKKL